MTANPLDRINQIQQFVGAAPAGLATLGAVKFNPATPAGAMGTALPPSAWIKQSLYDATGKLQTLRDPSSSYLAHA